MWPNATSRARRASRSASATPVQAFSPEDKARLFQAFEQIENTISRRHEGTGLGLYLSQKLAALLGGTITCDSEPGKGQHLHGRVARDVVVVARVLLVEDNAANLALMQYLLQASGYTTLTATDGREGVVVAQRESPDVILMDLQLPILNGYEAARQMKAIPALRGVPIIAVTAFAMVGDRDKILARGFDGYIAKPITPERFVSEVETFIASALRAD